MCRGKKGDRSLIKLCYIIFTTAYNVPKLAILSTVKHINYSMKYADLGLVCIKFLQYVAKLYIFDDSLIFL